MASVGWMPVTRQKRSRTGWGSAIGSKITRRYRAVVVDMIGADSPGGRANQECSPTVNGRAGRSPSPAADRPSCRPSGRRPLRHREELPDLNREARQDVAPIELHRGRQPGEAVRGRVDVDHPGPGPHIPDQPDALLEILPELVVHLLAGIAPADDLDGQVGDEQGDRLIGEPPPGRRFQEMNDHIGNPHQVDIELDVPRRGRPPPQFARNDEVA